MKATGLSCSTGPDISNPIYISWYPAPCRGSKQSTYGLVLSQVLGWKFHKTSPMLEWDFSCTNMITSLQSFWIVEREKISCKIPCTFNFTPISSSPWIWLNIIPTLCLFHYGKQKKIPSTLQNRYSLIFLNVAQIIWKCACRFSSTVASKLLSFYYLDWMIIKGEACSYEV